MAIEVVQYSSEHVEQVAEFNQRMHAGGSRWGWYEEAEDSWLPRRSGVKAWREHYLAIEDGREVRGAYALKPQEWFFQGCSKVVVDWQGPVTESVLSPKYGTLGLRLFRDMLKRYPLLYSWGHGGDDEPMLKMLAAMNWLLHPTPFCLKVLKPARFLRLNRYLRSSAGRALGQDVLAFTGLGWLGLKGLHGFISWRKPVPARSEAEVVAKFGPWADELWERVVGRYSTIALRDSATMNALLPEGKWPPGIRLRVTQQGRVIGWAVVMDNQLHDDPRFGDLRMGSVVDCLSDPDDAASVVLAASRFLSERGVDMICSNQAHPAWANAFAENGFVVLPNRRFFAASPELQRAMEPFDETQKGLHLTNLDGHGPHGL